MKLKGYLLGAISAISFGAIPLFAIPLMAIDISFDAVLFHRFFFTALMIALLMVIQKIDFKITGKEFVVLASLGILYALSSHFLFLGYEYLTPGIASTILFVYPVFVALILFFVFKEKIAKITWVAIILSLLGVFFLKDGGADVKLSLIGIGIMLLSSLAYSSYMILINKSIVYKMPALKLTFYAMLFCSFYFLAKSLIQHDFQLVTQPDRLFQLLSFALVTTVISTVTMSYAIQYVGSTPTAILGALEPLVAVSISIWMFGEPLTANLLIGMSLIISAVLLVVVRGSKGDSKL
ncbi:DMT family transporter [Bacteroidales bacterium OttesenSCG-928-B11]|nr:DMT family transporter [Bacteroidales bacterium OttesenSCG-928-B11]MDL2326307.1 DMT family transporter [Bacteroidales bacterium OttesenSCG-928-A14]